MDISLSRQWFSLSYPLSKINFRKREKGKGKVMGYRMRRTKEEAGDDGGGAGLREESGGELRMVVREPCPEVLLLSSLV